MNNGRLPLLTFFMISYSSVVQVVADAVEPWRAAYSDSVVLGVAVLFSHLAALLVGGGLAIAADRTTLRFVRADARDRAQRLAELHGVHRPVVIALAVLWVSGVLLAAADVETFAVSPRFWIKIALVSLLMVNGAVLYRTETGLRRQIGGVDVGAASPEAVDALTGRLRFASVLSLILWVATVLSGTVLSVAA